MMSNSEFGVFHLIYQKPIKCNQSSVGGGGSNAINHV
jgi:hypothetical protein